MNTELVLTFSSAHYAIQAESALLNMKLPVEVMPLPSVVRAGCGICLRLPLQDAETAVRLLEKQRIPLQQIYKREVENGKSRFMIWD